MFAFVNDARSTSVHYSEYAGGLLYLWAHAAQVYDIWKKIHLLCLFSMKLSSSLQYVMFFSSSKKTVRG